MRMLSWNCQGKFRAKTKILDIYQPNIAIIQECEPLEKLKVETSYAYRINDAKKSIAILCFDAQCKIECLAEHTDFKYVIPFSMTYKEGKFILFAVWAMDDKLEYNARYIGQVWKAINYYSQLLCNTTILIGDFNSNKIWDCKPRIANHSAVVDKLQVAGIESLYHRQNKEQQGYESIPTLYMYRKLTRPYHIDYCFLGDTYKHLSKMHVGQPEDWLSHSDHMPIFVDLIPGCSKNTSGNQ